ncbi:ABC transporter ATP-binding protein/permease [Ferruginibacter lapsinanis]|uniref:ABC transporter ATP-binding protein n=1 Tax=Ferruginibacter lapsinanis TaxID=563172 RepID=UPI001E33C464|nr:ABC transporter ATP-binding protein [Ferruginibacter lapsinanis]UEG50683.1 ABC transporter ATP-binding protein/permease [Ferruginibacter lapsinanis]
MHRIDHFFILLNQKMQQVKIITKLLGYITRYKGKLFFLLAMSFIGVGFEVMKPLPVKYIIDNVLSNNNNPFISNFFGPTSSATDKTNLLLMLVFALIAIIIISACISMLVSHYTTKFCQRLVHDLSVDLFDKMQRLSLSFYSKNNIGELLQRLSADVYVVYAMVAQIIIPFVTAMASLVAMFYIMAHINLLLACIAISTVPALALLLFFYNKPITESTTQQYSTLGELSSFAQQTLSSIKIVQAYAREKYTHKKFSEHSNQYSHAFIRSTKISVSYVMLTGVVTAIAGALVVGIGAYLGLKGKISIGDLFVFLGYIGALFGPVNSLSSTIANAVTIAARGKRIFEILDSDEVVYEKPHAIELKNVKGDVVLHNITFGYDRNKRTILQNMNLRVNAGEVVAVVGSTGAGKTSLVSLLLRFYDPWNGKVMVDGVDIADVKLESLRNNISMVLQDSFLFPVSIAENITFGNPDITMDEIIAAAKVAQAHEFISKLPDGYHTLVSEGGVSLSGGEKQRIALARAFLKKAPILILDEPTSSLDVQTETKMFDALAEYAKGKTVFIISHRLSTIRQADMIITIQDGEIVETGTHESLLKLDKVYANLYKYQHLKN